MYGQVLDVLARRGFHCIRFTGEAALMEALASSLPTLVLAARGDIAEGSIRAWRTCMRERALPVMVLAPAMDNASTVRVLDAGADDVVALVMSADEFIARVQAVLRAYRVSVPLHSIALAGFELDLYAEMAADQGRVVELTPSEFALAWALFSHPGEFLSCDALTMAVWGRAGHPFRRTLEQHVYKLRRKLKLAPERGVQIRSGHGRGYILEVTGALPQMTQKTRG